MHLNSMSPKQVAGDNDSHSLVAKLKNLALLDKSMNFGMDTHIGLLIIFGYGAPQISPPGGRWRHLY